MRKTMYAFYQIFREKSINSKLRVQDWRVSKVRWWVDNICNLIDQRSLTWSECWERLKRLANFLTISWVPSTCWNRYFATFINFFRYARFPVISSSGQLFATRCFSCPPWSILGIRQFSHPEMIQSLHDGCCRSRTGFQRFSDQLYESSTMSMISLLHA